MKNNASDSDLVSVGLLIYNAEKYLSFAIESILKQSHQNFELVISDNCSTDKTEEICKSYAAKDRRIFYHRNKTNIGAAKNYDLVFRMSKGKYFMWASFDDVWHEDFICKCLERLKNSPNAVACASEIEFINEEGEVIKEKDFSMYDNFDTSGLSYNQRFKMLLSREGWYSIFALIKRESLEVIKKDRTDYGSDVIILADLLRQGDFVKVPQKLFYYREFRKKTEIDRFKTLDTSISDNNFVCPNFSMYYEIMKVALKGSECPFSKLGTYIVLQRFLWGSKLWKYKTRDEINHYFMKALKEKDVLKIVTSLPFFFKFFLFKKLRYR